MEKSVLNPLSDVAASELPLNGLTPATSREEEHAQFLLSGVGLQPQSVLFDLDDISQDQQFSLQYHSTQSLFPMEASQPWIGSISQPTYFASTASSLLEQSTSVPISTTTSIRQDYVPLAKRPSIADSIYSAASDGEEHSTHDSAGERRKERRRAQNRAAQRAFRARKEETIKESSIRLDAIHGELARLQTNNGILTETVSNLRAQIAHLQRENSRLKRNSTGNILWDDIDMSDLDSEIMDNTVSSPNLRTEDSNDSGVFDVGSAKHRNITATGSGTDVSEDSGPQARICFLAEAIADAAANLHPQR